MSKKIIRNRNDLIKYLEEHSPRLSIQRAILEGRYENLGAFLIVPPVYRSGWIVKTWSKITPHVWYVVIQTKNHGYTVWELLDKVPWREWMGDESKNLLYTGDSPEEYKKFREKL